jgi:hypothetical protein
VKNVVFSIIIIGLIASIVIYALIIKHTIYSPLLYSLAAIILGASIIFGYGENIRSSILMIASAGGAYWAGSKTIETIDFNSPFLTSFYWSTLGYFSITIFLILLAIGSFIVASEDRNKI